jgi:hypothetical protein
MIQDLSHGRAADTSQAAFASLAPTIPAIAEQVLEALTAFPEGLTTFEIVDLVGVPYASLQPRTTELCRAGKVIDSGLRRANPTGKAAKVWQKQ